MTEAAVLREERIRDAQYRHHGRAAIYRRTRTGEVIEDVTVIRTNRTALVGEDEAVVQVLPQVRIAVSAIPEPEQGDRITIGSRTLIVDDFSLSDGDGADYLIETRDE